MRNKSEADANRYLSTSKGNAASPYIAPRKRKGTTLRAILSWLAFLTVVATVARFAL